jgi:hypothetical protein
MQTLFRNDQEINIRIVNSFFARDRTEKSNCFRALRKQGFAGSTGLTHFACLHGVSFREHNPVLSLRAN